METELINRSCSFLIQIRKFSFILGSCVNISKTKTNERINNNNNINISNNNIGETKTKTKNIFAVSRCGFGFD